MDLFIMWNLGLGDAIICNGLVREKAKEYEKVYIPCWTHNTPSVKFLFSDIPSIIVQEVSNPNEIFIQQVQHASMGNEILKLGCYRGEPIQPETFDQTFYRQAGVEFSKRWDAFHLPSSENVLIGLGERKVAFICDSSDRNFNIDDRRINSELIKIRPWQVETIFDFVQWLQEAEEIHTINSSWLHLIESISTKAKLFYHIYPRNEGLYHQPKRRKNWAVLT